MNFFKKSTFVKSVAEVKDKPEKYLDEVLFVGKSNVGKSSLINALVNNKKLAFTSKTPGHTRLLNYFLIEDYFYFVDSPGYGYSKNKDYDYTFYAKLIDNYLEDNENLKLILFLLDSRHEPTEDDVTMYNFLKSYDYKFYFVLTKCDKLNLSMKSKIKKNLSNKFENIDDIEIILTSSENKSGIDDLKMKIEESVRRN